MGQRLVAEPSVSQVICNTLTMEHYHRKKITDYKTIGYGKKIIIDDQSSGDITRTGFIKTLDSYYIPDQIIMDCGEWKHKYSS